jgi:hypothetical protein
VKPGREAPGGLLSAAGNVAVGGAPGQGSGGQGGGQGGGWEGHEVKTLVLTEVGGV